MSLRDIIVNFILSVLASLLANALYKDGRGVYCGRAIISACLKAFKKWRPAIEHVRALVSLLVRVVKETKGQARAGILAAIAFVSFKAKLYILLLDDWRASVMGLYSKRRNSIRAVIVSLPDSLPFPRRYPRSLPAVTVVAGVVAVASTLSLLVLWKGSERTPRSLPVAGIGKQAKEPPESLFRTNDKNDELAVSYWVGSSGILYELHRTDEGPTAIAFPADQSTIIGCGFSYPNHSVRWDDKSAEVVISSSNDEPSSVDGKCKFKVVGDRKIKSIVCNSYNPTLDPENTVGVCISTEREQNIFDDNLRNFIKGRTEDFYKAVSPLLKDIQKRKELFKTKTM